MDKKYIAVYNETAFSGIGIIDIEYGVDTICVNEYFGGKEVKRTRNKIYDDKDGRSYIKKYGRRYYMDEFMKL